MTTLVGVRRALQGSVGSVSQGGGPGIPNPTFWLPLSDAGAGAVNLSAYRASPGTAATFTRATSATCWGPTGLLLTVATGIARSTYTELTGATYLGYLAEEARTNEVLWNRDLTNAAWTKVNVTAAKDQTGIDGTASAASSLVSTLANGTTLQIITEASAARSFSVYMKRITGVGEIDITENGGTAWTAVDGLINSSTWTRVTILNSSVLNPSVGFRIVASGDKIAVDYVQNELGAFVTTPIATTSAAVARNQDLLSYPLAGNIDATNGTAYVKVTGTNTGTAYFIGSSNGAPLNSNGTNLLMFDGTTNHMGPALTLTQTPQKIAGKWAAASSVRNMYLAGIAGAASTNFDGDMSFGAVLTIGSNGTAVPPDGGLLDVKIWTSALSDAQIAGL